MFLNEYKSIDTIMTSDHSPVAASFTTNAAKPYLGRLASADGPPETYGIPYEERLDLTVGYIVVLKDVEVAVLKKAWTEDADGDDSHSVSPSASKESNSSSTPGATLDDSSGLPLAKLSFHGSFLMDSGRETPAVQVRNKTILSALRVTHNERERFITVFGVTAVDSRVGRLSHV